MCRGGGIGEERYVPNSFAYGGGSHLETNSVRWELIRRGIFMLHLYFVAFGAVAAANIIAVIVIAATMKRDRSRLWPLWLWPNLPK